MTSPEFPEFKAVITDTSCFILLDKIDALLILKSVFNQVITTPEIAAEFGKSLPVWIEIREVVDKSLQKTFEENVDKGEASAIALAIETPSSLVIIDDLKGRKLASSLHLLHTGTLGVLLLARKHGMIPLLRPLFDKIKSTDFRISETLLDNLLKQVGE